MIYIFDIECFINFFCVTFKRADNGKIFLYTIYDGVDRSINQLDELYKFIKADTNKWLVGYNSKYFDNQILNYIYRNYDLFSILNTFEVTSNIHSFMMSVISNDKTEYKYKLPFKAVDLMRVGNVEQKALKLVAVNLNWPVIQDLPFKIDKRIEDNDLEILYKYNLNDVEITERLYNKLIKDINVRWEVSQKYGIDVMSESDSGMANRLLEKMYSDMSGISVKDLKEMRTNRNIIHYENIIFDDIFFYSPILQDLLKELKEKTWFKSQPFFNKTIVFDGVRYKLGVGGLHSDDQPGIFESNDKVEIVDCDVASMYPSLIIQHRLFPAHLSKQFLELYKKIIVQRIEAKNAGNETESYVLKICLNSVFGKTLYEHHWLYDPLVGLRVTINGQLYMLMLIDQLVKAGFKVISANTDGLVTIVPKEKEIEYKQICEEWCITTQFALEYTTYSRYIRRDVNNYITIKQDGSTKGKGDLLEIEKISLRQGIDKPIVSKALYEYFVHGKLITDTIYGEDNIYNFCVAKKVDAKFINEYHTLVDNIHHIDELQKTVRYYVSTNGGTLYKVDRDHNKYINYCVGRKVTILNNNKINKDIKDYNIDYGYYITETNKIIDTIINPQLTLF
jgi:DNA polymerase elongation subunit (family B)